MQNDIEKKEPAFDSSDVRFNVKTQKHVNRLTKTITERNMTTNKTKHEKSN